MTVTSDIEARLGVPLGATLAALAKLRITSSYLELGAEAWDWPNVPGLEDTHGFIVVGKTGNGFFGPLRKAIKKSASTASWLYADRQGLEPERVGQLADFLSLWCYVPDFFTLHDEGAQDLETNHREFFESNVEVKRLVKRVLAIRGVNQLATGKAAAQLVKRVGGPLKGPRSRRAPPLSAFVAAREAAAPTSTNPEEEGQDFEVTMRRIREIEKKALAKLRGRG